ncbi:hypothetical protein G7Y89_g1297 [Cudoniella acicularis]|uniref:Transcription initiation factor TFIID subunit 4 n=1 Tax=Cudoniella acicularis TaxID=354080 RepID=A0A8H4RYH2_9HELO|nr:hypothetical protein G7Y89_g1297 [Cudoniella acicularis]
MAQPQQQYPMPQRPFSPPQSATSPGPQQSQFPYPQAKRARLSPNPSSQPGSPYVQSPYTMSPGATGQQSASASPHFANVQLPPNVYNTPYSNGSTTPALSLPQSQPNNQMAQYQNSPQHQSPLTFPSQSQSPNTNQNPIPPNYNAYAMAPQQQQPPPQSQATGMMGPPLKPAEKSREDGMDAADVLAGTGIDLKEEEQYLFNTSFNTQYSGPGHSFSQFPPGDEGSFYGAGPANAAAEGGHSRSQDEFHQKVADKAWHDSARKLASSRQLELNNAFANIHYTQARAAKIASEHGLGLMTGENGGMGLFTLPKDFANSSVRVQSAIGPKGAITTTTGTFLPADTPLADQIALLSLATKFRLRTLLEDAVKLAKGRQTGSHGLIPGEWTDAGVAPVPASGTSLIADDGPRAGWESAVSPHSNPLKRSFSAANKMPTPVSDGAKTPVENQKSPANDVVIALRAKAVKERDFEEARLRKRAARISGDVPGRQSSVAPGTPGSVAPEISEKAPTKKEQSKKAQSKMNEAMSHAAANNTTAAFLGGGGGLFGKKKKYSWMMGGGGGSGSGASTPGRIMTQGLPGTPGNTGPPAPEKLTAEPVRRLGQWREDQDKGKGIQLRDWVAVLEEDGREKKALQKAYMSLDQSEPK